MKKLCLLLLLSACNVFEPPESWDEFEPPTKYRVWHNEVQTCISEERSFDKIIWRKVHANKFHCGNSDDAVGCLAHPRTIYITQMSLNSALVVKSELIHYVRQNGLHDSLFWGCN